LDITVLVNGEVKGQMQAPTLAKEVSVIYDPHAWFSGNLIIRQGNDELPFDPPIQFNYLSVFGEDVSRVWAGIASATGPNYYAVLHTWFLLSSVGQCKWKDLPEGAVCGNPNSAVVEYPASLRPYNDGQIVQSLLHTSNYILHSNTTGKYYIDPIYHFKNATTFPKLEGIWNDSYNTEKMKFEFGIKQIQVTADFVAPKTMSIDIPMASIQLLQDHLSNLQISTVSSGTPTTLPAALDPSTWTTDKLTDLTLVHVGHCADLSSLESLELNLDPFLTQLAVSGPATGAAGSLGYSTIFESRMDSKQALTVSFPLFLSLSKCAIVPSSNSSSSQVPFESQSVSLVGLTKGLCSSLPSALPLQLLTTPNAPNMSVFAVSISFSLSCLGSSSQFPQFSVVFNFGDLLGAELRTRASHRDSIRGIVVAVISLCVVGSGIMAGLFYASRRRMREKYGRRTPLDEDAAFELNALADSQTSRNRPHARQPRRLRLTESPRLPSTLPNQRKRTEVIVEEGGEQVDASWGDGDDNIILEETEIEDQSIGDSPQRPKTSSSVFDEEGEEELFGNVRLVEFESRGPDFDEEKAIGMDEGFVDEGEVGSDEARYPDEEEEEAEEDDCYEEDEDSAFENGDGDSVIGEEERTTFVFGREDTPHDPPLGSHSPRFRGP